MAGIKITGNLKSASKNTADNPPNTYKLEIECSKYAIRTGNWNCSIQIRLKDTSITSDESLLSSFY